MINIFKKCQHYDWEYRESKIFNTNEMDCKNRWGLVHDVIQCKTCGKIENHVNWKEHFLEDNAHLELIKSIADKIHDKT